MDASNLKDSVQGLLGPETTAVLAKVYHAAISPLLSEPRLHWLVLVMPVIVAYVFFLTLRARPASPAPRSFIQFMFPPRQYLRPSAILDYKMFVINQLLQAHLRYGSWVVALVGLLAVAKGIDALLTMFLGPSPANAPASLVVQFLFTLLTMVASDFGKYVAHYLLHRIKPLWEFHRVHHAAEVLLAPLTGLRVHPVEHMLDFTMRLLATGLVGGVFLHFYPAGVPELTILAFNAIVVVLYFPIQVLQHSPVPLGYGPFWSRYLVSPLMHQVHHSQETRHWDRNMGFVFAIWDRLFGTLYVPAADEKFRLGLPPEEGRVDTLYEAYLEPFTRALRRIVGITPAKDSAH